MTDDREMNAQKSETDWDDYFCMECQEMGHPTPGTEAWDLFISEGEEE